MEMGSVACRWIASAKMLGPLLTAGQSIGTALQAGARRASRTLQQFGCDRRGATAIEFAFVAGPFFLMLVMVMELALFHFAQQSLASATRQAARQVMTGDVAANGQTAVSFRDQLICSKLLFGLSCNNIVVSAYKISLTSDASKGTGIYRFIDASKKQLQPPANPAQFCLGNANDYIFLDVSYDLSKGTNPVFHMLTKYGVGSLRSTTVYRNEPFQSGGATC